MYPCACDHVHATYLRIQTKVLVTLTVLYSCCGVLLFLLFLLYCSIPITTGDHSILEYFMWKFGKLGGIVSKIYGIAMMDEISVSILAGFFYKRLGARILKGCPNYTCGG